MNNFCSCSFYWVIFVLQGIYLTPVTTKEGMRPRDNFGPAWPSRKIAKCCVPNGKKVGTAGYKKLYCLCLMGWKSQKGKKNDGRQNAVGIIFISKIAKLNLWLTFQSWVLADMQGSKHPPCRCLRVPGGFMFKTVTSAFNNPGKH